MAKLDKTYYDILGVSIISTTAEIKRAYRNLVKTRHPDLDHQNKSDEERIIEGEQMVLLNQAYETLMDKRRRAAYDLQAGITIQITPQFKFETDTEDADRAKFLMQVFHPARKSISSLINRYAKEIQALAQDPYDDELMETFSRYLDDLENVLRKASNSFSAHHTPKSLEAAVLMMRHCIAQAADALEELRSFCLNYNYNHLTMAESLFKIAVDRSREANLYTKNIR